MLIERKQLDIGLKKARGVVTDSAITIEDLKVLYFLPSNDVLYTSTPEGEDPVTYHSLYLAGSDGKITFLTKIPYIQTEDTLVDKQFALPAQKSLEVFKYADKTLTIKNEEDSYGVEILTGNAKMKIGKQPILDESLINFKALDETDFDDVLEAAEVKFVLGSLLPVITNNSIDLTNQTIFIDSSEDAKIAYAFDGTNIAHIKFATNKDYMLGLKAVKQINTILSTTPSQKISFKYLSEEEVLVKTDEDTLTFFVDTTDLLDISAIMTFNRDFIIAVDKNATDFALHRTLQTSEEDVVTIRVERETVRFYSETKDGELSEDLVPVLKSSFGEEVLPGVELKIPAVEFLKLIKIMKGEVLTLDFDAMNSYCKIGDEIKKSTAIVSVEFS